MTLVRPESLGTTYIAPGTYVGNVAIDEEDLELIGTGGEEVTIRDVALQSHPMFPRPPRPVWLAIPPRR